MTEKTPHSEQASIPKRKSSKTDALTFNKDGVPFSLQFDDIYFDTDEGFTQSDVVFIQGNNIVKRLKQLASKSSGAKFSPEFVIGETGFGSGLNFLLTLKAYQALAADIGLENCPKLIFLSVEKFPMTRSQIEKSLSGFTELAGLTELFVALYPRQVTESFELNFFSNKICLKILIGDALEQFSTYPDKAFVDAWYLDGFSPSKNPDMWQLPLYQQMARLSKNQASISTFTVAGKVRRELIQAGFRLEKTEAHIKKKEILTGRLQQARLTTQGYKERPVITKPQQVAIIGGGIASACAAYALTQKGIKVTLYCKDDNVAQGASSNAIGALYPLIHQVKDDISLFYETAFWHAKNSYNQLLANGFSFEHNWCGLLELSFNEKLAKRQAFFDTNNPWSIDLIQSLSAEQASEKAGGELKSGGLFMPHAGWVSPKSLVQAVLKAAKATGRLKVKTQTQILNIKQKGDLSWSLATQSKSFQADALVLCTGAEGLAYNFADSLPMYPVRGQVTSMVANENTEKLSCVICHKGYLTPENHGIHCIGATFDKEQSSTETKTADDDYNLYMLQSSMPEFDYWTKDDIAASKARVRCMTPDHMPIVGAMPDVEAHKSLYPHLRKDKNWKYQQPAPTVDNLYILSGLGARGLVTAPLLADILAADLCASPYPVDDDLLFNLSPNRFVVRDIIKRKD